MSYTPNPQMVADLEEEIRLRNIAGKAMADYRSQVRKLDGEEDHRLKTIRRMQTVMSRTTGMGGMLGGAMNMLQGIGGLKNENRKRFNELDTKSKTKILTPSEGREYQELNNKESKFGNKTMDRLENMFEKNFGGDSKWNKMFGGQGKMAAAGLATGAVAGGIGLSKMIIDSSPAFQSLLKLLNFGIMLVLRPIGDFFALLFRPILLLLLRKLIIPFYQYAYPWFMKNLQLTDSISNSIDEVVNAVQSTGTAAVATSGTTLADNITKALTSFFPKVSKAVVSIPPATAAKGATTAVKGATKVTEVALKTIKTINAVSSAPFKLAEKAISKVIVPVIKTTTNAAKVITMTGANLVTAGAAGKVVNAAKTVTEKVTKPITNVGGKVVKEAVEKGATLASSKVFTKFIPIAGQVLTAIDASGSLMKQFAPDTYEGIRKGAKGIGAMLGDDKGTYTEGLLDFFGYGEKSTAEQITGLAGGISDWATGHTPRDQKTEGAFGKGNRWFGMAEGGMIKEPIKGVGKSGQKYMFGESGMEAVMPMRKIAAITGGIMGGGMAKKMNESRSQSPITINITVNGSIHSDRDMLNFQRTIMKAIETSSTRKSKL